MRKAAVTAVFVLACKLAADASSDPIAQAVRFFEGFAGRDPDAILRMLRPPPIRPEERARVLAALPDFGELQPDLDERAKLAMLETVLVYHERAQAFEIKVIDVPQAAVVLHQRAVLLISRPALQLISAAELQALIAHEIGHEYFWHEFEDTRERRDQRGRQELELKCDGIAVLTLVALRLDPARLVDGLRKLTRFNEGFGVRGNADQYPQVQERLRFMKALRELTRP